MNLKEGVVAEKDPQKRMELARQATLADYFLGSVHAVTMTGQLVVGSGSGSQIAAYAFMAKNLILVVGTHKITPNLDEALRRLREHCRTSRRQEDEEPRGARYGSFEDTHLREGAAPRTRCSTCA